MTVVRQPVFDGSFYPADPVELERIVNGYLEQVSCPSTETLPKALIVPHAGYIYSGPIAASAYAALRDLAFTVERVVLLGPSHRFPLTGLAATEADAFLTPLGVVPVDREALQHVLHLDQVRLLESAHALEHSLEVQLPFLQRALDRFSLVPLAVGEATSEEVAEVLEELWGGPETLIVISSDLSHYKAYADARMTDRATTQLIEKRQDTIVGEQACGCHPLNGLLRLARDKGLQVQTLDLRNSGDTAGPKNQVVGYGSYAVIQ